MLDRDLATLYGVQTFRLNEAAKRLAKPFGIEVSAPDGDLPLDPKQPFIIEPGQTIYQMLEPMARTAEALLWDDENGRLIPHAHASL